MAKDKNKITVFKSYFSLEKELEYINEMNKKGWKLVYIKGGCFYTFVRTQPDEYVTIMHGVKKEEVSSITAFASQCGYESIPHTCDGFGNLIYFTGRKAVVPSDFVSSCEEKIKSNKIIGSFYNKCFVMYIIISLLLLPFCFMFFGATAFMIMDYGFQIVPVVLCSIFGILCITFICMTIYLKVLGNKVKKKIKALQKEQNIYV